MNEERILRLADHMEKVVDPKTYSQDAWFEVNNTITSRKVKFEPLNYESAESGLTNDEPEKGFKITIKEGFCGSSACVLGHAATMPEMGLFLWLNDYEMFTENGKRQTNVSPEILAIGEDGKVIEDEFKAAEVAFDIPFSHARVLFGASDMDSTWDFYMGADADGDEGFDKIVTTQRVAEKLREYVATKGRVVDQIIGR